MPMRRLLALIVALLALWSAAGVAMAEDGATALEAGALTPVALSEDGEAYTFTPAANGRYGVYLFPQEGERVRARAELWQNGKRLAAGEGALPTVAARLIGGAACTVKLYGEGSAQLEIARQALCRCFAQPLALNADGGEYAKALARPGDAHWYSIESDSTLPVLLAGVPEEGGPVLSAELFDGQGRLLAHAVRTAGGACLLDIAPQPGQALRLRVSSPEGGAGLYRLSLRQSRTDRLADVVRLSSEAMTLEGCQTRQLTAWVSPQGAESTLFWESSDHAVARVDGEGRVTGRGEGVAMITAYAAGEVYARCRVAVEDVAARAVVPDSEELRLRAGDEARLGWSFLPENTTHRRVRLQADPEGVVALDGRGGISALCEGECTLRLWLEDDESVAAAVKVTVEPAPRRFRALLVGEQNYASTVASVRQGSANSVTALRSMLEALRYDGERFAVRTLLDASRDGVLLALREAFADAADGDLSLFYITCHGVYANGMTCFEMYDGSVLTAFELESALRGVPGEVMVIVDCCGSGGVLGRGSAPEDLLEGIRSVFGGVAGPAPLAASGYRVLASAALEQESYRLGFGERAEADTATVFARALCDAGGWSLERGAKSAMRADLDHDGEVTLSELSGYVEKRVKWYLDMAGAGQYAQTVQAWPEGDGFAVFERTEASP